MQHANESGSKITATPRNISTTVINIDILGYEK